MLIIEDIIRMKTGERDELISIATVKVTNELHLNLTHSQLEKDLWVTFLLKVLFEDPLLKDSFCFKGGTSLSKGFNVIKRFSEDIDLILKWGAVGYTFEMMSQKRTNRQQAIFNEKLQVETSKWIQKICLPRLRALIDPINHQVNLSADSEHPETIIVDYPHFAEGQSVYLSPSVRLEIGSLAALTPIKKVPIVSYISEVSDFHERLSSDSLTVPTVLPERTFWEKATILHAVANKKRVPSRYSRHYYDVYELAHNMTIKEAAFSQIELLKKVVEFKDKFYHSQGAHYELATSKTIRLVPDPTEIQVLKKDYAAMQNMFFATAPTFNEIIDFLTVLEAEIHRL